MYENEYLDELNGDDIPDWNELDDSDEFWEDFANDMSEDGYNRKTGEYHWIEMSHYRYETNYIISKDF